LPFPATGDTLDRGAMLAESRSMCAQFFGLLVLVAVVSSGFSAAISAEKSSKSPSALRASVHKALRESARSTDREASARRLMETYRTLADDTSLVNDDRLQMQQIVRSRLAKLADEIRKLPAASNTEVNEAAANDGLQDFLDALVEKSIKPAAALPPAVLAQQRGNINPPMLGRLLFQNAPQAAAPTDYGQDLVELIEATIAPGSWDSQGGSGTIRYFSPLRVIVLRQTGEVHEQLGDLLPQLRN
jgi:hypothetical protein